MNNASQYKKTSSYSEEEKLMWIMLFLFTPIGIYLMWKNKKFTEKTRYVLSVSFGLYYIIILAIGLNSRQQSAFMAKENTNASNIQTSSSITPPITAALKTEKNYNIKNLSTLYIDNKIYEKLYDKAKNASFAYIDSLTEDDYLSPENCSLTVFDDNSAAFILSTVKKNNIKDNTVLITFKHNQQDESWSRVAIIYNKKEYGNK